MILDLPGSHDVFGDLKPSDAAVFLDFDGVLVDLAEGPTEIRVSQELPGLLKSLERRCSGATAIVSGRAIADLKSHLAALLGWVAGSHGGEKMIGGQPTIAHPLTGSQAVMAIQSEMSALKKLGDGIEVEFKPLGAVAHYRRNPAMEDDMRRAVHDLAKAHDGFECHEAKMAFEMRPEDVGKDKIVADWLTKPPFLGRIPVYFGDDLTDEPAMALVRDRGGVAVKVGPGRSVADERLDTPTDVRNALEAWLGR